MDYTDHNWLNAKIVKLKWTLFIFDSYLSARSFANIDDNSQEHSSCLSLFARSKLAKEEIYLNFRFRENWGLAEKPG